MDFLHLKDASTTSDDSNRSSSSSSSSGGRKRCRMHSVSRRCENEDRENRGQRNDDDDDDDDDDDEDNVVDDDVKYGVTSVCGRRREMEDMVSVHLYFTNQKNLPQIPIHFFGVFDGHGCSHVSMSCMNRMHEIVKEEIDEKELGETEEWKKIMRRSFRRMDEEVMEYANKIKQRDAAVAGSFSSSQNICCRCELQTPNRYDTVGSTALVLLLMPHKLIIANCGDSRAVLSRKTTGIFPLSSDHKPDRPDELSRIESGGGHVIYWEGARVLGVLAMSRAIGDSSLKPYVIPEPEVVIMDRRMEDEFIILATDGLWDVVTNETACDVVRACMQAQQPSVGSMGGGSDKTCSDASILLTKLAIAKHSSDNISIVVIDLGTHHQHHHC